MPNNERFYSLKRPCADCPFRADGAGVDVAKGRRRDILETVLRDDTPFYCHKTVDYGCNQDEPGHTAKSVHCAGMTILLEKLGRPTLSMKLGAHLGLYDPADTRPHWAEVMDPESILEDEHVDTE